MSQSRPTELKKVKEDEENKGSIEKENREIIVRKKGFRQEKSDSSMSTKQKITGQNSLFNDVQVLNTETLSALSDETQSKVKGEEKKVGEKRKTSSVSSETYLLQPEKEGPDRFINAENLFALSNEAQSKVKGKEKQVGEKRWTSSVSGETYLQQSQKEGRPDRFRWDGKRERETPLSLESKPKSSALYKKQTMRIKDIQRGVEELSRSKTSGKKTTIIGTGYEDSVKQMSAKILLQNHHSGGNHSIKKENEKPMMESGKNINHRGKQLEKNLFAAKSSVQSATQSSKQHSAFTFRLKKSPSKNVLPASEIVSSTLENVPPTKSVSSVPTIPNSFPSTSSEEVSPSHSGFFKKLFSGQPFIDSANSSKDPHPQFSTPAAFDPKSNSPPSITPPSFRSVFGAPAGKKTRAKENSRISKEKPKLVGQKVEQATALSKKGHQLIVGDDLIATETSSRLDHQVLIGKNLGKARNSKRLDPQPTTSEFSSLFNLSTKHHQQLVAGDLSEEEALEWKTRWREL